MYGIELAHQTRLFFMAVGLGFFAGVVFDLFRILRLAVSFGKIAVAVQDVIYILLFLPSLCLLSLKNMGEIRLFAILGELIGFIIYYLTFGSFVYSISGKLIALIRRVLSWLFKIISYPFIKAYRFAAKIAGKIGLKLKKMAIKTVNKLKFRLQRDKALLYNVFGDLYRKRFKGRKRLKAATEGATEVRPLTLEERRAAIAREMELFVQNKGAVKPLPQTQDVPKGKKKTRKQRR